MVRGHLTIVLLALLALAAAGCSVRSSEAAVPSAERATTTTVSLPQVTLTPAAGATDVPLDQPLGVTVAHGTIAAVTVTSPAGPVKGTLAPSHQGWLAPAGLTPTTTYTVTLDVVDGAGKHYPQRTTFTTGTPAEELHTSLNVEQGGTYGVGMPIIVTLNHPVPAALHHALEQRLTVDATPDVVGAWRWLSDTVLHWRPQTFWPAGTKVTLGVNFTGFDVGGGVWGVDGRTVQFSIGDSHISMVDAAAHKMTITDNGKVLKVIPVSTGSAKYPTHSGIHVVNGRQQKVIMDSATVGIPRDSPDGYYETVYWDTRISNSGEFVHAAPWSVGSQGSANVSHGCVNASTADAEWFFNFSRVGDVVIVANTPLQLQPWNGYGDFQIPWSEWAN